jgi:YgiT-type zinc finger domain-containing protein
MSEGFTTHVADLGNCIIIIRNVPCLKCTQCGETAYIGAVVKQIENLYFKRKEI